MPQGVVKKRMSRFFEKHVVNPIIRQAVRIGIAPRAFALLETTGRKTGLPRVTPIGGTLEGDSFWLVAEHGDRCDYVRNLMATPAVRVKVGRRWRAGCAVVIPDDDGHARRRLLDRRNGLIGRLDGFAFRAAASAPMTIRVDLDRSP